MTKPSSILTIVFFLFVAGCASSSQNSGRVVRPQAPGESKEQVVSAMENVLGAVSGKPVNEKDLQNLNKQIQKDPEAKSAVQAITNSMNGRGNPIKYCPIDGERYSPKFETCPIHHVPLKILSD